MWAPNSALHGFVLLVLNSPLHSVVRPQFIVKSKLDVPLPGWDLNEIQPFWVKLSKFLMELSSSIYVALLQAIYTLFAWTSYAAALQESRNMWTENCLHCLKFHGTENPDFFVFPLLCYSQIWISSWLCWFLPPAAWERKVIKKNLSSSWMTKWMFLVPKI